MPHAYVKKAKSDGERTASTVISGVPHAFHGALVFTDGTNNATLTIYDNASAASGTVIHNLFSIAAACGKPLLPPPLILATLLLIVHLLSQFLLF